MAVACGDTLSLQCFSADFERARAPLSGERFALYNRMPTDTAEHTDRRDTASRETLLELFRSEMRHAPGLALTLPQAARLFNIQQDACERLVDALAAEGLIQVREDGRFVSTGL